MESLRIVSPTNDGAHPRGPRLPRPDRRAGARAPPRQRDRPRGPRQARRPRPAVYPLVERWDGDPYAVTSVRDVAMTIYGRPDDIEVDSVVDLVIVGAGPAGLAAVGVRRLRGALHRRHRGRGDRRAGRHQLDDPQLPRLPPRHLRDAAGPARPQPGDPLRRPLLHRLAGDRARRRARRRPARRAHRGRRRARPGRRDRLRRHLPQARRRVGRLPGRAGRQLRRRHDGGPRDGGVRRVRGRRRELRRPGRDPPGPLRPQRHHPGAPPRPGRDHVGVPDQRDPVQPADLRRGLPAGGRRRRRRAAGVDRGRGHLHRRAHPPRRRRAVPAARRGRPLRLAAARGRPRRARLRADRARRTE